MRVERGDRPAVTWRDGVAVSALMFFVLAVLALIAAGLVAAWLYGMSHSTM